MIIRIAILSDTHGWLDPGLNPYLTAADEVWHAGDIGSREVLEQLQEKASLTRVVYGNIDSPGIRALIPEYEVFEVAGLRVLLIHIAGRPPRYNRQVHKLLARHRPGMLVCGHSHILKVARDRANNLLYINPGAAGHQGFHRMRTLLQLEVADGRPCRMQAVELGRRGRP